MDLELHRQLTAMPRKWHALDKGFDGSPRHIHDELRIDGRRARRSRGLVLSPVAKIFSFVMLQSAIPLAWTFPLAHPHRAQLRLSSTCFLAKPPPISSFDLEAIEAFEEQLEKASHAVKIEVAVQDNDELNLSGGDVRTYTIPEELHNTRIDAAIATLEPSLSRSHCGGLVTAGNVRIVPSDGKEHVIDRKSFKVDTGAVLRIHHPTEERPTEIIAQNIPLDILFEDEHIIVLNKAVDMVVHPGAGNWDGTVVNALAHYLANNSPYGSGEFVNSDGSVKSEVAEGIAVDGTDGEAVSFRPGIVHRLDKGTTGVLVVAKTRAALAALSEAFAARSNVRKTYLAVTVGNPGRRVVIDKPIGRHPVYRQRMRVVPDPHKKNSRGIAPKDRLTESKSPSQAGRRALSFVDTLAFDGKLSVVQVRIETGRTHQIRVHLQDRHTPVYGDGVYGLPDWNKRLSKTHHIERPLLHAHKLEIDHPITGEHMIFQAPMASDMLRITKAIWPQGSEERADLFSASSPDE